MRSSPLTNNEFNDMSSSDECIKISKSGIPFLRSQLEKEFDRYHEKQKEQSDIIEDSQEQLKVLYDEAMEVIQEKAKLISELSQIIISMRKSGKAIDNNLQKAAFEQFEECGKKLQVTEAENKKIEKTIRENKKYNEQLNAKVQTTINEHNSLINQLSASVPVDVKYKIKDLNDSIDDQKEKAKEIEDHYILALKEKDEIISQLTLLLNHSPQSGELSAKKEILKRPALIKRDNSSEPHQAKTDNANFGQVQHAHFDFGNNLTSYKHEDKGKRLQHHQNDDE